MLDQLDGARAVLFDVDGTLYRQGPVRRSMVARLVRAHLTRPATGLTVMRVISAYRTAQETLREEGFEGDVTDAQLAMAAARTGLDTDAVREVVERWMEVEPLGAVAVSGRSGLVELLDELGRRGTKLGALSDYPAAAKLEALGIADRFAVVLSAQDPRVQAFKPNPKGLRIALEALEVEPSAAVYVGDRAEVDEVAAAAVPMRCVLVGGSRRATRARRAATTRDAAQPAEPLEAT
ncbi:MAG: HAD family hydrolase [Ilumatobacteraceae bacterium]